MAAVDFFLKIDGIPGESADSKHKDEIDIQSFSWGVTQGGTFSHGGGGGAGKATFQDLHFTMRVSKASPKLMLACADGEHIKKAVLIARKAGKEQQEFYKVTMSDLLVSSYQTGGSSSGEVLPVDQFSLNFAKVEVEYKVQNVDGTLGAATLAGYDIKANKKV
jgi:type VI secretion system secreted protein Hcp